MAERTQSYKNHGRMYPLFHYVAFPILLANFLNALRHLYNLPNWSTAFAALVAFGLAALALATRLMVLTVQDRVIRLEMQLRLMRVLPPDLQSRVDAISRQQFVALRFAGDDELPGLVREICEGRLSAPKDIKQRVKNWQADWLRA